MALYHTLCRTLWCTLCRTLCRTLYHTLCHTLCRTLWRTAHRTAPEGTRGRTPWAPTRLGTYPLTQPRHSGGRYRGGGGTRQRVSVHAPHAEHSRRLCSDTPTMITPPLVPTRCAWQWVRVCPETHTLTLIRNRGKPSWGPVETGPCPVPRQKTRNRPKSLRLRRN